MSIFRTARDADIAASQVRSAANTMNSLVSDMHAAGVWTGADAGRLVSEWQVEVTARLLRAATRIDNLVFSKIGG